MIFLNAHELYNKNPLEGTSRHPSYKMGESSLLKCKQDIKKNFYKYAKYKYYKMHLIISREERTKVITGSTSSSTATWICQNI